MTNTHDSSENPKGMEEGVADALVVLENLDPRMLSGRMKRPTAEPPWTATMGLISEILFGWTWGGF